MMVAARSISSLLIFVAVTHAQGDAAKALEQAENGRCSEVLGTLTELGKALPANGNVAAELGRCQRKTGDTDGAKASIARAEQLKADSWRLLANKAEIAFAGRQFTEALDLAEEALGLKANYLPALEVKGRVLVQQRNYAPAIEVLEEVFHRAPSREACLDLAKAQGATGAADEEKALLAKCPAGR